MNDLVIYLVGINVLTFLIYGIDKWKARKGKWRIPAILLVQAVLARPERYMYLSNIS